MRELPQVTAVIPVHNHEKWVAESILSVVHNKYPRTRMMIVDDGSTDNSHHQVMKLLKNSNKINVPKDQEPRTMYKGSIEGVPTLVACFRKAYGPSFARNYGIRTGWEGTDLFAFLDSDDLYLEGKIEKSVVKWLEYPNQIGVIYSDYNTFGKDGIRHRQFKEPFSIHRLRQECIINCDSLVSKLAFEKCGLFDENIRVCEDFHLWARVSKQFLPIHLPEALVDIRVGEHSATSQVKKDIWNSCYAKVMEEFQKN